MTVYKKKLATHFRINDHLSNKNDDEPSRLLFTQKIAFKLKLTSYL